MDERNPAPDGASLTRPSPTVDDFVTWSEIEQKIQRVAKPEARPRASTGNNLRWGWVAVPILLGLFRFIGQGTRNYDPPPHLSPASQAPRVDRQELERIMQEAQQKQDKKRLRPADDALDEFRKARNQQEPLGSPKP
jgi:hypothetical protein